jgi:hypothetical protein
LFWSFEYWKIRICFEFRYSNFEFMNISDLIFGRKGRKRPKYQYRRLSLSRYDVQKIHTEWERIEKLVKLGQSSQLRQAVIKADNILDFALSRLTTGTNTGERLKNARPYFKDYSVYQSLWQAHKVRNALVHEADYEPTHYVSKDAINKIKHGLAVLGVAFSNPKGS